MPPPRIEVIRVKIIFKRKMLRCDFEIEILVESPKGY